MLKEYWLEEEPEWSLWEKIQMSEKVVVSSPKPKTEPKTEPEISDQEVKDLADQILGTK